MKTTYFNYLLLVLLFSTTLFSCKKKDSVGQATTPKNQYTPNVANWDGINAKILKSNKSNNIDDVHFLSKESWEKAKWDGKPYNPTKMSKDKFTKCMCPTGDQIRGIREVFNQKVRFQDPRNPTKAEVDAWHTDAINHIRALVGYTQPERQIQPDHCLFARAQWGNERQYTKNWDKKYPGKPKTTDGPCVGVKGAPSHCGASFFPDKTDQIPYLPAGYKLCDGKGSFAEGILVGSKANIPWSIKFSRSFCAVLGKEGYKGGHVNPFFHRSKYGFAFWDSEPGNHESIATLRAKWSGKLLKPAYK